MESGRVRLTGTGAQLLAHPEMRNLYLGGTTEIAATPVSGAAPGRDESKM